METTEKRAGNQGFLNGIVLFQKMHTDCPLFFRASAAVKIPNDPLINTYRNVPSGQCFIRLTLFDCFDKAFFKKIDPLKILPFSPLRSFGKTAVQRKYISIFSANIQNRPVPFAVVRITGNDNIAFRIQLLFEQFTMFAGESAVFSGGHMPHFPRAVKFITQTPVFDIVGFFHTVGTTLIAPVSAAGEIAVFIQTQSIHKSPVGNIYGHQRFGIHLASPFHKFIQTEGIRFQLMPRRFESCLAVGPHAVFPAFQINIASAGVAGCRHIKFPNQTDHIFTETIFVGDRRIRLIHASVNITTEVFYKTAVDFFFYFTNNIIAIQRPFYIKHNTPLFPINFYLFKHTVAG